MHGSLSQFSARYGLLSWQESGGAVGSGVGAVGSGVGDAVGSGVTPAGPHASMWRHNANRNNRRRMVVV